MATMLNGAAVMDGALLLSRGERAVPAAADERAPRRGGDYAPWHTSSFCRTKSTWFKEDAAAKMQHEQIREFSQAGTVADGAPIVPISAQLEVSTSTSVCEYIVNRRFPSRCEISRPRRG